MWEIITGETNRKSFKTTIYIFSTISFTYYFILFKHHKSPTPQINVVCSKRNNWGSKIQHWFGGRGGDTQGEGIDMSTKAMQKGAIL